MLPTLLATKLQTPHPAANPAARSRLTQRLSEGLRTRHRLFLAVASRGMAACSTSKTMILEYT